MDDLQKQLHKVLTDFPTYAQLLQIRNKEGKIQPFTLNFPQQKYYEFKQALRAKSVPIRILILKYRQGGFSTFEQAESYWKASTLDNQEIITMAHTEESAKKIFQMVQLFHELMVPELKADRKRDNSAKLQFPRRRCNFEIATAGSAKIGITLSKAHLSEAAFYDDLKTTMNLLKEAIPLSGELVLESTANGFNYFEELYSGAQDLLNPRPKGEVDNAFYRFFIRWFEDPQYQLADIKRWDDLEKLSGKISIDEKTLIERWNLSPMQIAWRRWKLLECNGDYEEFWQMYPEDDIQCFISTGKSYFNIKEIMTRMIAWSAQYPPIEEDKEIGLKIWEKPDPNLRYVAGADPAQGVENDNSALHILEEKTGRTVLTMANNTMSPHEFAIVIHKFCVMYNDAYLVVERNNHGHTVLSELINHLDYNQPWQLYHHEPYYEGFKPLQHQINKELNYSYEPGFPTKSNTKAMLLDGCKKFIEEYPEAAIDKDLIGEIKTFKRLKGGKLGAEPPKKDDRVIALSLAQWGRATDANDDHFSTQYRMY